MVTQTCAQMSSLSLANWISAPVNSTLTQINSLFLILFKHLFLILLIKSVHFKKPVTRISFLSKLWYFLFWFVLKVPQFWKKRDSRNWLLKMNGLYQETLLLLASTAAKMAVSWLKGSRSLKGPCHVPNFIRCCQQHSVRRREVDDGNGELGYHRHLWIWFTEQQPAEGPVAQGPLKIWMEHFLQFYFMKLQLRGRTRQI